MSLQELLGHPCGNMCNLDKKKYKDDVGKCLEKLTMGNANTLRKDFYGDENDEVISTKERGIKTFNLLIKYYDKISGNFHFTVGQTPVCERSFMLLLGIYYSII